jgi:hypothetical protein
VSDSANCSRCGARGDAACVCGMPPSIARQMPPPHLRGTVPAAKVYDPHGNELRAEIERLRGLLQRARYHVEMNGIDRCVWGDAAGGLAAQKLAREIDEAIGAPATPAPAAR